MYTSINGLPLVQILDPSVSRQSYPIECAACAYYACSHVTHVPLPASDWVPYIKKIRAKRNIIIKRNRENFYVSVCLDITVTAASRTVLDIARLSFGWY